MSVLNIVKEFPAYKFPGPRYRKLGQQSGEAFREDHFIPWLKEHLEDKELVLDVNDFAAYPPSFFKEFILGTANEAEEYKRALLRIKIQCRSDDFRQRIESIIKDINNESHKEFDKKFDKTQKEIRNHGRKTNGHIL